MTNKSALWGGFVLVYINFNDSSLIVMACLLAAKATLISVENDGWESVFPTSAKTFSSDRAARIENVTRSVPEPSKLWLE